MKRIQLGVWLLSIALTANRMQDGDPPRASDGVQGKLLYSTVFADESEIERWEVVGGQWTWSAQPPSDQGSSRGAFAVSKPDKEYAPKFRSPRHLALLKDLSLGSVQIDVWVHTTQPSYPHRDVCVFFGFVDPEHFYYAHLGQRTDDHANQIFLVNAADRIKVSAETTSGTPWSDTATHHIRVIRDAKSGSIAVYFDDMQRPVMRATEASFGAGRIGIGSFDDAAEFLRVEIRELTAQ